MSSPFFNFIIHKGRGQKNGTHTPHPHPLDVLGNYLGTYLFFTKTGMNFDEKSLLQFSSSRNCGKRKRKWLGW